MALESGTYISDLVATNPDGASPKSSMDDHLRLIKSTIKTTFPNVTGAMTMTHTQLNTVTARGLIAGQTWTGTHQFPATTYGVTAAFGASGTALATLDYVNAVATNAALPGQTGNEYKFLRTNGTTAAWSELGVKGANIASAATINLTTATGDYVHVTGTTTITAITIPVGAERTVIFDGVLTLTHAAALLLPGAANITTAADDRMTVRGDTAGAVVVNYAKASGLAVVAATVGLSLLSSVTAVGATTVDIETGFSSTYDSYVIICDGFANSAGGVGRFLIKTGGVYDAAANYYFSTSGASTVAAANGQFNTYSDADTNGAYVINIFGANGTEAGKIITGNGASRKVTPGVNPSITTYNVWNNAGVIQGVRLYMSAGTISGNFKLYGIRKA